MEHEIKSKIFFGSHMNPVDDQFNIWISVNNNVGIISVNFQLNENGTHAIFVLYRE